MSAEVGELIVGAYLKLCKGCDFVDYNVRPRGGGLEGLEELDVVGMNFLTKTAYLCEATTHLRGLLIKNAAFTVQKIKDKHKRQIRYADKYLKGFEKKIYMYWSPNVGETIKDALKKINKDEDIKNGTDLKFIFNADYADKVEELKRLAKKDRSNKENSFYRTLQILELLEKKKK